MGIDPEASGYQNIILKLASMGLYYKDKALIESIVEFSGLKEDIRCPVKNYSSGMSVRLAFSISTCVSSDILLLDEWLSVGDKDFSEKSSNRLKEICNLSKIMIIASHNIDLLKNTCNVIYHMENGEIVNMERL